MEETPVAALVITSSKHDCGYLEAILGGLGCRISAARTCEEAAARIREGKPRMVVCEADLPDGNWKDILENAAAMEDEPALIVTSRLADERLWAEVLNRGGYDVLAQPFDTEEVTRVLSLALGYQVRRRRLAAAV
jgi:DNA-binding NtrC family response regulator